MTADRLAAVLARCRPLPRPGGHVILLVQPGRSVATPDGAPAATEAPDVVTVAATRAGLVPVERCLAPIMHRPPPNHRPSRTRRRSADRGHRRPVPATTHLDVYVFRVPPDVEAPAAAALPVPTPTVAAAEGPPAVAGTGRSARRAGEVGRMTPVRHEPTAEPVQPSMRRPYYRDGEVTLHTGDAIEVLATLRAESVDCVVTSPPYWGLRDYGTGAWTDGDPSCPHPAGGNARPAHRGAGPATCPGCGALRTDRQYGLEATAAGYVEHLRGVFAELARVLAPTGTVWLNLGDSYSSNSDGYDTTDPGKPNQPHRRPRKPVGFKNLVGMPWRVAFALQDDGWILRNAIVWHKLNGMPESVADRMTCTYELVFLLVRSRRYRFDLDPVRIPLARPDALGGGIVIGGDKGRHAGVGATARRRGHTVYGAKYADNTAFTTAPGPAMRPTGRAHDRVHPRGKNPGDLWPIPTRPLRAAHFAAFPIDLPLRCIAAGCPPDGIVLDPVSGAGTTGLAARQLSRRYQGIDLNAAFHRLALDRLGLPRPDTGAEPDSDQNGEGNAA